MGVRPLRYEKCQGHCVHFKSNHGRRIELGNLRDFDGVIARIEWQRLVFCCLRVQQRRPVRTGAAGSVTLSHELKS
jgi:hypothetical protein